MDMHLVGIWAIIDSPAFLSAYFPGDPANDATYDSQVIESWLNGKLAHRVRDAIRQTQRSRSAEDLITNTALSAVWWSTQIEKWLHQVPEDLSEAVGVADDRCAPRIENLCEADPLHIGGSPNRFDGVRDNGLKVDLGVRIQVTHAEWRSAENAAWEAEQARDANLHKLEQERERQREAERREAVERAEYEAEKARIKNQQTITQYERDHQLQILEHRHRRDCLQMEEETAASRRAGERAAAEHQLTMAKLQNDQVAVTQLKAGEESADRRLAATLAQLADIRRALETLASLPGQVLAQVSSSDLSHAYNAVQGAVTLHDCPPALLARLGIRVGPQLLVGAVSAKEANDGALVQLTKPELRTRDIVTKRVQVLSINTSLQFELTSRRAGYVTFLNVGTSGKVWLHVPNAYVRADQTQVLADRTYQIPGDELLPWTSLRQRGLDYVEGGPPGWEHLVAIVSNEPLVAPEMVSRATPDHPFITLDAKEVEVLQSILADRPAAEWTACVLSFLVG